MDKNKQSYNNHTRLFPLHHFIVTPLSLFLLVGSIMYSIFFALDLWGSILLIMAGIVLFLLPIIARIYATKNQDRIIRVEMRQRYFELTGNSFRSKEMKLNKHQIIALRFASDDELVGLIDKAIQDDLSPKIIKQSVQDWQPDHWRV